MLYLTIYISTCFKIFFLSSTISFLPSVRRNVSAGHPIDAPRRDMDSHVIDAEAVLPFSRGAKYMDNHPSAVPANARERKKKDERKGTRATGAPNAAKLITAPCVYVHADKTRSCPRSILSSRTYLIARAKRSITIAPPIGNLSVKIIALCRKTTLISR